MFFLLLHIFIHFIHNQIDMSFSLLLLIIFPPHIFSFDLIIDPLIAFENQLTAPFDLWEIIKKSEEKKNYSILLRNADFYFNKTFQLKNDLSLSGENASLTIKGEGRFVVDGGLNFKKMVFYIDESNGNVFQLKGNLNFQVKMGLKRLFINLGCLYYEFIFEWKFDRILFRINYKF